MSRLGAVGGGSGQTPEITVGARVEVTAGPGIVRWVGANPAFATGKWVGVELTKADGKNDGSVKGERYFTCEPLHGVFVRPSQVTVIRASRPASAASSQTSNQPTRPTSSNRPSSTSSTSGLADFAPPTSSVAPARPSLAARGAAVSSSAATPHPASPMSKTVSTSSSAASYVPSTPAIGGRLAAARLATATRRAHTEETPGGLRTTGPSRVNSPTKPSASISPLQKTTSLPSLPLGPPSAPTPVSPPALATKLPPAPALVRAPAASLPKAPSALQSSAMHPTPSRRDHAMEELRIKLRIVESKRAEDLERLRALESQVRDAEDLKRIQDVAHAKMQARTDSSATEHQAKQRLETENASLQKEVEELSAQLESVTLDKEIIEERCEELDDTAERLRAQLGELQDRTQALETINANYEQPPEHGSERSDLSFVRLENENHRLREAFAVLREKKHLGEQELKAQISALRKDLASTSGLQAEYDKTKERLDAANHQVAHLKTQLDDALGAEDMLELLTEKNLAMGERLEQQRITIEELEALCELNDELVENHLENEKELREEIVYFDNLYHEECGRGVDLEEALLDAQSTIGQFRELVLSMQTEMDSLRQLHETQASETAALSTQSQTVINMNLRLQSSAIKAQAQAIDLELQKVDAAEAHEHLAIVRTYLPQVFLDFDADAAHCVLFFDRLAQKTALINNVVGQTAGLPETLHTAASETLAGTCEMRGQLSRLSMFNRRFAAFLRGCSPEAYIKTAGIYHELSSVEKRIDWHISLLRTDEFKETECIADVFRFIAQYEHLASAHFEDTAADSGVRQLDLVLGFDFDLDNFAAAVGFARQVIVAASLDPEVVVETANLSLEESIYAPIQHLLDLVKSVKLASRKIVRRVEDLVSSSAALRVEKLEPLRALEEHVANAVNFAIQLAKRIGGYVSEIRSSKEPLQLRTVLGFLREITLEVTGEGEQPWDVVAGFVARLGQEAATLLPTLMNQDQVEKVIVTAPWIARAEQIAAAARINAEAEQQMTRLTAQVRDLSLEIKKRDYSSQEAAVRIQLLERRVEAAKQQAEAIQELEYELTRAKRQERTLEDNLELIKVELDASQQATAKLQQAASPSDPSKSGGRELTQEGSGGGSGSSFETYQLLSQLEAVRGALNFLRRENAHLRSADLLKALPTLPLRNCLPALPALKPSITAGSSEDDDDDEHGPPTPGPPPTAYADFHRLETEATLLFRELGRYSASPQVVDLTAFGPNSSGHVKPRWVPRSKRPEAVLEARRKEGERLECQVMALKERAAQARAIQTRQRYGF